ncbi:CHAP domain protein [Actinomadura rubteroloni]|uniref:CHAP domain protein n=1 Tax=Actinomadura rubteroloni TaxID=1926885 RepID=A0A2P4UFH6_9ACTN|nr:CHAP domain-containing protein [Actinomadura rubteroloni]POM23789.1 CHAP domain protein [Actinomadura rubteroloni]
MDPIGKKMLAVVKSELGYTEKGDGYTKFGEWYRKNVDGDHDAYFTTAPWCDMFLAWAASKAGVAEQAGQFASTIEHAHWFRDHGAWGTKPEPGAFVFYDWSGSGDIDQVDHVGIVESVQGRTIHTIEGNADGYQLTRKTRSLDDVVGFGYPGKMPVPEKYTPKHAAPPAKVENIGAAPASAAPAQGAPQHDAPASSAPTVPAQDVVLGGVLALILCGTAALAVGRATAAKAPTTPPIRVRKRGRHHRTAPVELPVGVTPADLDAAESTTTVMPALSLAAAHAAEDHEFWGRIDRFRDDDDLAFWDALHAAVSDEPAEYATAAEFR